MIAPNTKSKTASARERVLSDDMVARITAYFPRYPSKRAVTLPALHIVHEELRCVPLQAVVEIAQLLELAPSEVQDTLSFYQFFKQDAPHGRTRAWVCRSISCALRGGEEVLAHLCHRLGTKPGEASADGRITVEAAECLGACELAPCMLANETLIANMTVESADAYLTKLQ
jgi:NADH-quinone oxidoreductase subunit E